MSQTGSTKTSPKSNLAYHGPRVPRCTFEEYVNEKLIVTIGKQHHSLPSEREYAVYGTPDSSCYRIPCFEIMVRKNEVKMDLPTSFPRFANADVFLRRRKLDDKFEVWTKVANYDAVNKSPAITLPGIGEFELALQVISIDGLRMPNDIRDAEVFVRIERK